MPARYWAQRFRRRWLLLTLCLPPCAAAASVAVPVRGQPWVAPNRPGAAEVSRLGTFQRWYATDHRRRCDHRRRWRGRELSNLLSVDNHRALHRGLLCRGGLFLCPSLVGPSLVGAEDEGEEAQDERHEQGKRLSA